MLTLEAFEKKHKELIKIGAVEIRRGDTHIHLMIDRFFYDKALCEAKDIKPAQADARKMGYKRLGIGWYIKEK